MGIKLYRLAKDVDLTVDELLELARESGLSVKSHFETLAGDDEQDMRTLLGINGDQPEQASGADLVSEVLAEQESATAAAKEIEEPPAPEPAEPEAPAEEVEAPAEAEAPEAPAEPEAPTPEPTPDEPGIKVVEENPALALQREGMAVQTGKTKRSERETQLLNERLEKLRHKARSVARIPQQTKKKKRPQQRTQTTGTKRKADRRGERDAALRKIREKRETTVARTKAIVVNLPITIKDLSQELGTKANEIIQFLLKEHGTMCTINQHVEEDLVELIALQFEKHVVVRKTRAAEEHIDELEEAAADVRAEDLESRPPVVAVLGHVDHGKTSILDKIRETNVQAGEAGGITQHLSAWQVEWKGKMVTFIDTPGHAAFTAMRARGAQATDIVVLVVAADDGVMPQTEEAINHAKAAGTPIIVALNKIDKDNANPEKSLQQLAGVGLQAEDWGGETQVVRCSAITGEGIPELLETIDLVAEVEELQANPNMPARGIVLEGKKDEGVGNVATLLIKEGTLGRGSALLAGLAHGRVRTMVRGVGAQRQSVAEAGPSTPVEVTGLSDVPDAGDQFFMLESITQAKEIAGDRVRRAREQTLSTKDHVSLDDIFQLHAEKQNLEQIQLIVKADVKGSIEVLKAALDKRSTSEVKLKIIHSAIGGVNESDVLLADASNAMILGFNVAPEDRARALAEEKKVEIRQYTVIYELLDDIKKAMEGLLRPDLVEEFLGRVEIRKVFKASKLGNIAGCMVTKGLVRRNARVRLIRDGKIIQNRLELDSLKRFKEDAREVKEGFECGLRLKGYNDVKEGDQLDVYEIKEVARTLDE